MTQSACFPPKAHQLVHRREPQPIVPTDCHLLHIPDKVQVGSTTAEQSEVVNAKREPAKIMPLIKLPISKPNKRSEHSLNRKSSRERRTDPVFLC